jgi:formylglycine-generating enzyme required for sulfatase activity
MMNVSRDERENAAQRQKQAAATLNREVLFCDYLKDGTPAPAVAFIPAGRCIMGAKPSEYQAQSCEMPQHEVTFARAFALTQGTIRRREYNQFLIATGHKRPRPYSWIDEEFPVFNVSIKDAMAYAAWLSAETQQHYRLPTPPPWGGGA